STYPRWSSRSNGGSLTSALAALLSLLVIEAPPDPASVREPEPNLIEFKAPPAARKTRSAPPPTDEEEPAPPPAAPGPAGAGISWNDGFLLRTDNGDLQLLVGGRVHNDWLVSSADDALDDRAEALGNTHPFGSGTRFRRARINLQGQ